MIMMTMMTATVCADSETIPRRTHDAVAAISDLESQDLPPQGPSFSIEVSCYPWSSTHEDTLRDPPGDTPRDDHPHDAISILAILTAVRNSPSNSPLSSPLHEAVLRILQMVRILGYPFCKSGYTG